MIPTFLLGKIHDLSEYLGHLNVVNATIEINIENSHYYFSVNRSFHRQQSMKPKNKAPSDYRRNHDRITSYRQERKNLKKSSVQLTSNSEFNDFNEKNLLNCSFVSDVPFLDDETKEALQTLDNEIEDNPPMDIDNPDETEATKICETETDKNSATEKYSETEVDKISDIEADKISDIEADKNSETKDLKHSENESVKLTQTSLISDHVISIKSPENYSTKTNPAIDSNKVDDDFQTVKRSRKNENNNPKTNVNIYICEKTKDSARTKVKLALNWMENFMGSKVTTAPVLLCKTPNKHYVFLTKVRSDKYDEFVRHIQLINPSSWSEWNIVAVTKNNQAVGNWKV